MTRLVAPDEVRGAARRLASVTARTSLVPLTGTNVLVTQGSRSRPAAPSGGGVSPDLLARVLAGATESYTG